MKKQELKMDIYTSIPIKYNDKARLTAYKNEEIKITQLLDE